MFGCSNLLNFISAYIIYMYRILLVQDHQASESKTKKEECIIYNERYFSIFKTSNVICRICIKLLGYE